MSEKLDVAKEINDVRELLNATPQDQPFVLITLEWTKQITDVVYSIALRVSEEDLDQVEETVTEAVLDLYDNVIVPYDIKTMNDWVERLVEAGIREALPRVIKDVFGFVRRQSKPSVA